MRENAKDPQKHAERMKRKREAMARRIERADQDRGVLIVLTGPGKGKSSSAFGMIARTLGHGGSAHVMQFIKGKRETGETLFFRELLEVPWHVMGEGFTWDTADRERDTAAAQAAWATARGWLTEEGPDLVVLDELCIALRYEYLAVEEVLTDLAARPAWQHVVITGRNAPRPLTEGADTVSHVEAIKHAFAAGVRAQPGVEW